MDDKVRRYYRLKRMQKDIERELAELRGEIVGHCEERGASELEIGGYTVKLVHQERKEYDDGKLYAALPDPALWRMVSKADVAKIASLIKLNVISEERLGDTFAVRNVTLLQVDKK